MRQASCRSERRRRGADDRVQRTPVGHHVRERAALLFLQGAAARRIYAGQGAVPRVPQGDRDHHLPGRLADDGRRRADGQLRDLLREPETVGGQGRRGGRQVRRQDALHPAALLECQDAAHLFERRYEDRPERRRQRLSGRGLRVGRSLQGVAFPPLHGENGCRCEPGGRRTVRIGSCRRGRPAGRRKDAAVRDPPACRFRTCACRCGRTRPCRLGRTVAGREPAPETGGKPAAGSEAAAIVSNPAAEGNPADTVKKGQPAAAEHKRAAEAGGKPAAGSGAAVPGETPTGEKTPDNGDPAPAALSPQTNEPQTEA